MLVCVRWVSSPSVAFCHVLSLVRVGTMLELRGGGRGGRWVYPLSLHRSCCMCVLVLLDCCCSSLMLPFSILAQTSVSKNSPMGSLYGHDCWVAQSKSVVCC